MILRPRPSFALAKAQLSAARAQIAEIRAQLVQAERDYARQRGLADRQLISTQALEAALTQRDMLRARLASTEEQIGVAQIQFGGPGAARQHRRARAIQWRRGRQGGAAGG